MTVAALLGILGAVIYWRRARPSARSHGFLCAIVAILWLMVLVLSATLDLLREDGPAEPVEVRTMTPPAAV